MMILVDTHAHLDAIEFDPDREEVISRAQEAGLYYILSIAIDLETSIKNIALAEQYPFIYTSCGLHPNHGTKWDDTLAQRFKEWVHHPKVLAIGETGLDFYREYCPIEQQYFVFEQQIQLAQEANLPLIIHCRDAHEALLKKCDEVYRTYGPLKGVIHCFSGGPEEALRYIDYGFYISFAGPLTYKKNKELREALKQIPLDRVLVETDCPYLAPQSKRGQRNEPAYVSFTAQYAAEELKMNPEDFGKIVTENSIRLFGLPAIPQTEKKRV